MFSSDNCISILVDPINVHRRTTSGASIPEIEIEGVVKFPEISVGPVITIEPIVMMTEPEETQTSSVHMNSGEGGMPIQPELGI
jgi:hypothetical protein